MSHTAWLMILAVNEIVVDFPADVPDPHTLLAQIPPDATHFTVIDLWSLF